MITHGRGYLFGLGTEYNQEEEEILKVAEDGENYV